MKKRNLQQYFFIYNFFLIVMSTSFGQTSAIKDSLSKYTYDELSDKFYAAKRDSLKAVSYAKYYVDKAKREKDTLEQAEGNYYLSDITKDSVYFVNYWQGIIKATEKSNNPIYPSIAYLELGDFFFHKGDKDFALNNYLLLKERLKFTENDSIKSTMHFRLGLLKNNNNYPNEALKLFKTANTYYNNKNINIKNVNEYFSLSLNLSSTYSALKLYDSAFFYNKNANSIALKFNKKSFIGYITNNYGKLLFKKKSYSAAIDSLKSSISYITNDENYYILSKTYYYISKSYLNLKDKKNTLKYCFKIDSLFEETSNYYNSQKPAYKFLISYYKKEQNDAKQLEYINKYIKVDSVLNIRSKSVNKSLTENYDIPNLLAEKKLIENRLKGDLSTTKNWVFGIGALALLLALFLVHQTRKRKTYKKRFEELMNASVQVDSPKEATIAKKENAIPKETIENILNLLLQFEKDHAYISSEITLSSLAKTFETNSKYLSQLINQYKGKSFNNYVNELRTNYAVERLKTDSIFRKYSIKAIACEVGFNTTESFSKAFFKNTGIRPSFFIKELAKK